MSLLIPSRKTYALHHAARLKKIVGVFAKYGFQDVAERVKLGRFLLEKFNSPDLEGFSFAERVRMAFEELGPTFVKLGQLLAQRPDLVPKELVDELKKLHDQVPAQSFEEIQKVLKDHFGDEMDRLFSEIEPQPLGAASIAQVHRAQLTNGEAVVLKVQRPGIEETIQEDLGVLATLADLLNRYVPESRIYNPKGVVEEFSKALKLETNFVVEANNIRRFAKNFASEPDIKVPRVYENLTGRKVLVMEFLEGIPLSQKEALNQEGIDPETIMKRGLRCYLKMVFTHGMFHGDLHAGNMFVLPNNQIGLIDFGVVGRLNRKTQTAIANMLLSLADEDYDRLAYLYLDLAPYTGHVDVDRFARDLRDLIAPYYGLTLKHVNVGKMFLDSTSIAAKHRLLLPSELVLFFKSIVTIEGMGRIISKDFDFLAYSLEFASELLQSRYEPARVAKDFSYVARDVNSLIQTLPRQLKQFFRKLNSPEFALKVQSPDTLEIKKTLETSSNLIFLGLVIGSLILSSAVFSLMEGGPRYFDIPIMSLIGFALAGAFGMLAFYNYIKR